MRDLHNVVEPRVSTGVIRQTNSSSAVVGSIIDLQGYDSCEFVIVTGALTDTNATFAVTMDEGNVSNLSDAAAVAAADLLGTYAGASFTFADDNAVKKIGYKGSKRYVRLTVTPTSNDAGNLDMGVVCLLGNPMKIPTP
jgi:hypothetical protein